METFPSPVAGIDYPRNLQEFDRWFADEAACRSHLRQVDTPFHALACWSRDNEWRRTL